MKEEEEEEKQTVPVWINLSRMLTFQRRLGNHLTEQQSVSVNAKCFSKIKMCIYKGPLLLS